MTRSSAIAASTGPASCATRARRRRTGTPCSRSSPMTASATAADPRGAPFTGKRILVAGGTGSLGRVLVQRLLSGAHGQPASVTVLSRDEAKQYEMRLAFARLAAASED